MKKFTYPENCWQVRNSACPPVFVGGVGGSGTRVVTDILMKIGLFMGDNLNSSNDYMELSNLLPKFRELMQFHGTKSNPEIIDFIHRQIKQVQQSILNAKQHQCESKGWGWKVPPNFFILEYLNEHFPDLKYIHVIRHGLDMAFSSNRNQLFNWGFYFDINTKELSLPKASLKYWIKANRFAINLCHKIMPERFFLLYFDNLCLEPRTVVKELSSFLKIEEIDIDNLIELIKIPNSIGRYKREDISIFDDNDIKEVAELGFAI